MSFRKTQILLLLAGSAATMTAGCVTGTNTFSSIARPETSFCSNEDAIQIHSADANRREAIQPQFDRVSLIEE